MKYHDNITQVAALQPDYLGFIFYEKSSRFFNGIIPDLPKAIKKVGVFVDASLEFILDKIETYQLDVIQLHGQETPEFCGELRTLCHSERSEESNNEILNQLFDKLCVTVQHDIKIIKIFSIKDHFDFSVLQPYENVCDYFLFDTKGKLPGGNGYTFNWEILKHYPSTTPYFLSGGIGVNEVKNIKLFLKQPESKHCYAIDINSKFEIESGLKNIEELKKFKESTCLIEHSRDIS